MLYDKVQQSKRISLGECDNQDGLLTCRGKIYGPEYDPLKLKIL